MELYINYKYRAPGAHLHEVTTITTTTMDVEDSEIWTNPHPVGDVIPLRADEPEKYGEQPKEYRVVQRIPMIAPTRDSGYSMAALTVIVTDP